MITNFSKEIEDLFALALRSFDEESDAYWIAICKLHQFPVQQTLEAAISFTESKNFRSRCIGAAVLGQLGHSNAVTKYFLNERFAALIALLTNENNGSGETIVLSGACYALGHLHDSRAVTDICKLAKHDADEVRLAVACGLSGFEENSAIECLVSLMNDRNPDVRDWATFAIGSLTKSNEPLLRNALYDRLTDEKLDVRNEAILGLALRGDERVLDALVSELSVQVASPLFEAAAVMPAAKLLPALQAARKIGKPWPDSYELLWEQAIVACRGTTIENRP